MLKYKGLKFKNKYIDYQVTSGLKLHFEKFAKIK